LLDVVSNAYAISEVFLGRVVFPPREAAVFRWLEFLRAAETSGICILWRSMSLKSQRRAPPPAIETSFRRACYFPRLELCSPVIPCRNSFPGVQRACTPLIPPLLLKPTMDGYRENLPLLAEVLGSANARSSEIALHPYFLSFPLWLRIVCSIPSDFFHPLTQRSPLSRHFSGSKAGFLPPTPFIFLVEIQDEFFPSGPPCFLLTFFFPLAA